MADIKQKELESDDDVIIDDGDKEDDVTDQAIQDYKIKWYGVNLDIAILVDRFERNRIFRPDFQRQYVWTKRQASRLIESLLKGLPIPSIFLYQERDENIPPYIIDGLQRIVTLSAFKKNYWPSGEPGASFNEKIGEFRLVGLPENSPYFNKTYDELDEVSRERFDEKVIHVLYIEQRSPEDNESSAFHIFERLNTGGSPLHPQEMRNALHHGKFSKFLYELTRNELWGELFGKPNRRLRDQEIILRFLALRHSRKQYSKPMKIFLNKFMNNHRNAEKKTLSKFEKEFSTSLARIYEALGPSAFKPGVKSRAFNVAVFDSFMVAVAENNKASSKKIAKAFSDLLSDEDFQGFTSSATADESSVKGRIQMARDAIK